MIKEQITHNNFDGNVVTSVLHFNLNRVEVGEMLYLMPRFERFQQIFDEPERDLTREEITEMLELVKIIMRKAYGIRSDDGERFIKSDEIWERFTQTNAYDAFLFSLFESPTKADEWMKGLMPKQLIDQAAAVPQVRPVPQDHQQKQQSERDRMAVVELPQPAENVADPEASSVPTPDELAAFRAWQDSQKNES